MASSDQYDVCIIGAGQAGSELAFALRQQHGAASIVIIGNELHPPYQRPPLSKACLKGDLDTPSLYLRQRSAYERLNVELLLDTQVERIDPAAHTISLASGRRLHYSKLALTTGGRARRLGIADAPKAERAGNFHYLRTIGDVLKIRAGFATARRLVIIGGGYIGLEVAATAVTRGLEVTVLEALPRVLARVTAPEMSSFYERVHRQADVELRTGVDVIGFEFNSSGELITGVKCRGGETLAADLVLVGIGLVPNTELAQAAGLLVEDGIVVDEYARTSDPDVVAAGDCANHPSACSGRRVRIESVSNAVEQARTAAATIAGNDRPHAAVPWFWSDQYDLKLQMTGLSSGYQESVLRGSMENRSFTLFYLKDGRVIASDSVNRPRDFMASKQLIGARSIIAPLLLADESIPLKQHLSAR